MRTDDQDFVFITAAVTMLHEVQHHEIQTAADAGIDLFLLRFFHHFVQIRCERTAEIVDEFVIAVRPYVIAACAHGLSVVKSDEKRKPGAVKDAGIAFGKALPAVQFMFTVDAFQLLCQFAAGSHLQVAQIAVFHRIVCDSIGGVVLTLDRDRPGIAADRAAITVREESDPALVKNSLISKTIFSLYGVELIRIILFASEKTE